ncbi:MAG: xanthine dehydrogenase family protein subunit M [Deltaproteobacteria bacterium]|nr:xanthine dehydrogenase family protein subunit M [Deltaproteobacteria bacterium]
MIPRAFEYFDPPTLEEAVRLLERYGEDAKLMAGGQSLLPMMKLRVLSPAQVVDLWRVPELEYIRRDDGVIRIGAMTTHYALNSSPLIRDTLPALADAARVVGDPLVRNLGTIGGSAAHAAHNADYPAVLVALGAAFRAVGPGGERTIAAEDFFTDMFTTALEASEIVTEVTVPVPEDGNRSAYLKLSRRGTDFAIVGVAAALTEGEEGRCTDARVVLSGVGSAPVRVAEAEEILRAGPLVTDRIREAGEAAKRKLDPPSDVQADARYRVDVSGVYVRRAVAAAWGRKQ